MIAIGPPAGRLRNMTAIVTGAGRGIGQAIATTFAQEGARVVVAARTREEVEGTADGIRARGGQALAVPAEVADPAQVERMVARATEAFQRVDILVNNAGILGPIGPAATNAVDEWVQTIQVNLIGTWLCCRAVLPSMLARRAGSVINLSGGGATRPRPHFSAYSASKAAVVRLTETLAAEAQPYGVRVNAIAPGAIATRLTGQVLAAGTAAGAAELAEARAVRAGGGGSLEAVVALAVFLASDESQSLTGKLLSARHDGWEAWGAADIAGVMSGSWLTLRRIDRHTLGQLRGGGQA